VSWTCSDTGKRGTLALHPHELVRRWLLHVLPRGFARLRHYGFMAGAAKETRLRVRALLGQFGEPAPDIPEREPFRCDHCGGELKLTGKLDRIRPRGPLAWRHTPEEEEQGGAGDTDN
jgi:Putative transposase